MFCYKSIDFKLILAFFSSISHHFFRWSTFLVIYENDKFWMNRSFPVICETGRKTNYTVYIWKLAGFILKSACTKTNCCAKSFLRVRSICLRKSLFVTYGQNCSWWRVSYLFQNLFGAIRNKPQTFSYPLKSATQTICFKTQI